MVAEICILDAVDSKKNLYKRPTKKNKLMIPFTNILNKITIENVGIHLKVKLGHTISKFNKFKSQLIDRR